MTDSHLHIMKRARSEDGAHPPLKFSSAQVRRKGQAWSKHPYYYFEDGSLLLLVSLCDCALEIVMIRRCLSQIDKTAYCIHGSVLSAHSPYWRDALGEPKAMYEPQELNGILCPEMDAFLSVLYPQYV